MSTEAEIQRQIKDYLELRGWLVKRNQSGGAYRGKRYVSFGKDWPDLLAMRDGTSVWIEVKRPGEALRPGQVECIALLRSAGQRVLVAESVEDIQEAGL